MVARLHASVYLTRIPPEMLISPDDGMHNPRNSPDDGMHISLLKCTFQMYLSRSNVPFAVQVKRTAVPVCAGGQGGLSDKAPSEKREPRENSGS